MAGWLAITRLFSESSDVGAEALQQEIEAGGFIEAKIITQLAPWRVLARRPESTQSVTR